MYAFALVKCFYEAHNPQFWRASCYCLTGVEEREPLRSVMNTDDLISFSYGAAVGGPGTYQGCHSHREKSWVC